MSNWIETIENSFYLHSNRRNEIQQAFDKLLTQLKNASKLKIAEAKETSRYPLVWKVRIHDLEKEFTEEDISNAQKKYIVDDEGNHLISDEKNDIEETLKELLVKSFQVM